MKTTKQWLEEYKVPDDSLNAMGYVLNVRELIDAVKAEYKPLHDANHRLFEYLKSLGIESMIESSCADTATIEIGRLREQLAVCQRDKERLEWLDEITFLVPYLGKPEINTSSAPWQQRAIAYFKTTGKL